MDFEKLNEEILLPSEEAAEAARKHWDNVAKPVGSLGLLEDAVTKIAALIGSEDVHIEKRTVITACADNGVLCEGVASAPGVVTLALAREFAKNRSSVCRMAAAVHADVIPVDMGMSSPIPGTRDCRIAAGTQNMAVGPAMTREQAIQAIQTGMDLVKECKEQGYQIIATGELGMGNTTTSTAVTSALLGISPETLTGRGAGLSDEGLARKCSVIHRAIECNRPDPGDALDVLSKLGGFDIACMAGLYLGGALYRVPVIVDGLISSVAALVASRLCPKSKCAMIASHCSAEPAAQGILDELGLSAVLYAGLRLGEGTGSVCMFPILDMALSVYHTAATYGDLDCSEGE